MKRDSSSRIYKTTCHNGYSLLPFYTEEITKLWKVE